LTNQRGDYDRDKEKIGGLAGVVGGDSAICLCSDKNYMVFKKN
jgi:hypothetical protein